jgi:hypothetical protein
LTSDPIQSSCIPRLEQGPDVGQVECVALTETRSFAPAPAKPELRNLADLRIADRAMNEAKNLHNCHSIFHFKCHGG